MNLKDFLNRNGKGSELYWALVIEPGWVQSAIWDVQDGKAQILATSPISAWESDEELIESSDASLSAAIQTLPEDTPEPEKTVFGVPPSWVSNGQIKEEFLGKIKKVCAELSLTPSGFVVLPEAISHLFKSEEGAGVSAIILGVSKDNLELTVFRLGNLVGTTSVARSVSIFDDVVEGLTRFGSPEPLPSRIILYNGKGGELEDLKQELIKADWAEVEKIKFLHTPKVEILETEKKVIAVSLAGASEIADVTAVVEEKEDELPLQNPEVEESVVEPTEEISAEDMGFVVGGDAQKAATVEAPVRVNQPTQNINENFAEPKPSLKEATAGVLAGTKNVFGKVSSVFSKIPTPNLRRPQITSAPSGNRVKPLLIGIGVILVGLILAWLFLPKATVTIFVSPQVSKQTFDIAVDSSGAGTDLASKKLAGRALAVDVSGEKVQNTSGTKTIGDKAKGSVSIRNGMSSNVTLPASTVLVSLSGLEFITDRSASVSAALAPDSPGTATVTVVAKNIGSEGNLATGEVFKVGNYPKADVDAVSSENFSGGSSREISAVSTSDQASLKNALEEELRNQALNELSANASTGEFFLEESLETTNESTSFSNKVGDEAASLKLNLEMSFTGLAIDKNAVFDLAKHELGGNIPQGYALRNEQLDLTFKFLNKEDSIFNFETDANANLLPQIDPAQIAKKIAAKTPAKAEDYLRTIPGFTKAEIKFSRSFPGPFKIIPLMTKNINIEIAAQR